MEMLTVNHLQFLNLFGIILIVIKGCATKEPLSRMSKLHSFPNGSSAIEDDPNQSYISSVYDWDSRSSAVSVNCVSIPPNLNLCANIGYNMMRLPNFLEHETLPEVSEQASSWTPLVNIKCDEDFQRFICSVYCPVCLDQIIPPCRSLCEKVKRGCEGIMNKHKFQWPDILFCEKFPVDNDMCVRSRNETEVQTIALNCKICKQSNTTEFVVNHYCETSFAVRAKLNKIHHNTFTFQHPSKIFRSENGTRKKLKQHESLKIKIHEDCCLQKLKIGSMYFIMGVMEKDKLTANTIIPWDMKKSKLFKKAIRKIKKLNCSRLSVDKSILLPTTKVP